MGSAGGGHPSVWEHLLGQPEQTPLLFAAPMIPPGVGSRAWSPHMGHSRGQTPQTWAQLILNCWDQRRHPRCCSSGAKLSEAQTPRGGHDAHAGANTGGDTRQQEGCCQRDRGCRGGRVWGRMAGEGKGGSIQAGGLGPSAPLRQAAGSWHGAVVVGGVPVPGGDLRTGAGSGESGGGRGRGGEELQPPAPPGCAELQGDEPGAGA